MGWITVYGRGADGRLSALKQGEKPSPGGERRYRAQWREPSGKVRTKVFRAKHEAERHIRAMESAKDQGVYRDPSRGKQTFGEFFAWSLEVSTHLRPRTRAMYEDLGRLWLLPAFADRSLGSIDREQVTTFIASLSGRLGEASIGMVYRLLRRTLQMAADNGRIPANPATRIRVASPKSRQTRFLSAEEVAGLAQAVPSRYRALILTLSYAGLRFGEAAALRMREVDLMRGAIRVERTAGEVRGRLLEGPTKSGQVRTIRIPSALRDELASHVAAFGNPRDPGALVFTASGGGQLHNPNFRSHVWLAACRQAGIAPTPRIHDLRHTAVALAIEAGYHAKEIQQMLGHSSIAVTYDIYGHLLESTQDASVERLDALMRGVRAPAVAPTVELSARRPPSS